MLLRGLFVALVCVMSVGCYYKAPLYTKANEPQVMEVNADRAQLIQATEALIEEQGLWLLNANPKTGKIVAVSDTDSLGGMVTRQRWVFVIADGQVSVQSFLDHVKDGEWTSTDAVCETYGYAAERAQLGSIDARITLLRHRSEGQASVATPAADSAVTGGATASAPAVGAPTAQ